MKVHGNPDLYISKFSVFIVLRPSVLIFTVKLHCNNANSMC